jgi:hypothetical protein
MKWAEMPEMMFKSFCIAGILYAMLVSPPVQKALRIIVMALDEIIRSIDREVDDD